MNNIKQALAALDPAEDDHWTADGLPRVEAVTVLMGSEVTRRQITDAAPTLARPQSGSLVEVATAVMGAQDSGLDPVATPPSAEPDPKPAEPPQAEEPEPAKPEEPVPEEPTEAPSAEDPESAARVQIHDQVVSMREVKVVGNVALMDRAVVEFGRQATILVARGEAIRRKLKEIGRRSASLQAVLNRRGHSSAEQQRTAAISRYLEAQRVSRTKRAERARKFIEAGTTAGDVKAQLESASKIDTAMKSRKPPRSALRPVYPATAATP